MEGFNKLSPVVALYEPPAALTGPGAASLPGNDELAPQLIVYMSWMGAATKHIAKYISGYQARYPGARILVTRNSMQHILTLSNKAQREELRPAVDVIRAASASAAAENKGPARILLQVASNGGSQQACQLAAAYREVENKPLPITAMVLDSTPGLPEYWAGVNAFSETLPKQMVLNLLGKITVHLALVSYVIYIRLWGEEDFIIKLRRDLNDSALFNHSAPRCYLYSIADTMVQWEGVEKHAEEAIEKGWKTNLVKFQKSLHVSHVREDANKFWGAIEKVWKDGVAAQTA